MSLDTFGHQYHHHGNPWDGAPAWAVELGAMVLFAIAKLNEISPGHLTPEQQAAVDKIFNIEVSDKTKIDDVLSK